MRRLTGKRNLQGAAAAKQLRVKKYIECSAKTSERVKEVLEYAALYALQAGLKTKSSPGLLRRLLRYKE